MIHLRITNRRPLLIVVHRSDIKRFVWINIVTATAIYYFFQYLFSSFIAGMIASMVGTEVIKIFQKNFVNS